MAPKRRSQAGHIKGKRQRKATSRAQNKGRADALPDIKVPVDKGGNKALECSICRRKFRIPLMLPCGHCFCKDDLICLAPLGTETISCPQCREQFPVPNGDTTQFPINYHLKELVDEQLTLQRMTGGGEVKFSCTCCDVGNQSEVVAKCQECGHYLCTTGLAKHKHYQSLQQHNVFILEEITEIYMTLRSRTVTTSHEYKYERKADDWAIFDALYDGEHSTHLLRYCTQVCDLQQQQQLDSNNNSNRHEAMVNHYLMCLDNLEESGLTDRDSLAKKQLQVAIFFKQAGQYDKAIMLIEKTLDIERKELSERPENMAQLYYQAGCIYLGILNSTRLQRDIDESVIQNEMKYARLSLNIRKTMNSKENDNKFELAKALRLLSDALRRWKDNGGDSVLSAADAKTEGMKYSDESIEIFKQLNAKGSLAKSIIHKANLQEDGSEEQERLYRESHAMCEEAYGEYSVLSVHLHRNMCILYEERKNYHEAYKWLVKSREISEKLYGQHHPQTQLIYEELGEQFYVKIRKELESSQ